MVILKVHTPKNYRWFLKYIHQDKKDICKNVLMLRIYYHKLYEWNNSWTGPCLVFKISYHTQNMFTYFFEEWDRHLEFCKNFYIYIQRSRISVFNNIFLYCWNIFIKFFVAYYNCLYTSQLIGFIRIFWIWFITEKMQFRMIDYDMCFDQYVESNLIPTTVGENNDKSSIYAST